MDPNRIPLSCGNGKCFGYIDANANIKSNGYTITVAVVVTHYHGDGYTYPQSSTIVDAIRSAVTDANRAAINTDPRT